MHAHATAHTAGDAAAQAGGPDILLVGHAEAELAQVRAALAGLGTLHLARTESEALALCQARRFELLLLNHPLVDADGLTLLAQLQGSPDRASPPVIVLSATFDPRQRAAALALGAVNWLSLPIEPARLRRHVQAVLHWWLALPGHLPPQPQTEAARVLAIEDDANSVTLIDAALRPLHIDLLAALNGADALQLLAEQAVDVILLDVELPDTNGYALALRLAETAAVADVPLIFLTRHDLPADEQRALEIGAVDFIRKPFAAGVLRARVANVLRLRRPGPGAQAAPSTRPATVSTGSRAAGAAATLGAQHVLVNLHHQPTTRSYTRSSTQSYTQWADQPAHRPPEAELLSARLGELRLLTLQARQARQLTQSVMQDTRRRLQAATDEPLTPAQREALRSVFDQAGQAEQQLAVVTALDQIDDAVRQPAPVALPLRKWLGAALELARAEGLGVDLAPPSGELDALVWADPHLLRLCLASLLQHIQLGQPAGSRLNAEVRASDDAVWLHLGVVDAPPLPAGTVVARPPIGAGSLIPLARTIQTALIATMTQLARAMCGQLVFSDGPGGGPSCVLTLPARPALTAAAA
jgi:DNA-binding response OmpR family regulator